MNNSAPATVTDAPKFSTIGRGELVIIQRDSTGRPCKVIGQHTMHGPVISMPMHAVGDRRNTVRLITAGLAENLDMADFSLAGLRAELAPAAELAGMIDQAPKAPAPLTAADYAEVIGALRRTGQHDLAAQSLKHLADNAPATHAEVAKILAEAN